MAKKLAIYFVLSFCIGMFVAIPLSLMANNYVSADWQSIVDLLSGGLCVSLAMILVGRMLKPWFE